MYPKLTVDWVVTDGHDAIAKWHAAKLGGIVNLRLRSGRWWWRAAAVKSDENSAAPWTRMRAPGIDLGDCDRLTFPDAPSADNLLMEGFIGKALSRELSSRLPVSRTSNIRGMSTCSLAPGYLVSTTGGVEATFASHEEYLATWFTWVGRTTDQEGAIRSSSGAAYSFTLKASRHNSEEGVRRPTPPPALAFKRNSTIDVWFPYVLASQDHYVLSVSNVTPGIDSVPGTLNDNVLHFVLPAFTLHWGDVAHGEIETTSRESTPNPKKEKRGPRNG